MERPPLGLCIKVKFVRVRDGDTIIVKIRTGQEAAIRLIGVDAPELNTEKGKKASAAVDKLLRSARNVFVWIPPIAPDSDEKLEVYDILRALTFDRIPGRVFADDTDVSEWLVEKDLAERV